MIDWILEPWPWYVGGPLIAIVMFVLLYLGKTFGISSNLRTLCTIGGAGKKVDFFNFDWKTQRWNLLVVLGAFIGGFIASNYLSYEQVPAINQDTISKLTSYGIYSAGESYVPTELFGNDVFTEPVKIFVLLVAGFFVGFGARYAGGCTSGHSISGISNLQLPSLIATIGFFIGGLIMVHLIFPVLLNIIIGS